jgi:hypothetical protein
MNDRTAIIAALIVGGAIVASSFQSHSRYALSAGNNNVAWRMDTWSGQIDICTATYLPNGPIVRCGAVVVTPTPPDPTSPGDAPPASSERPPAIEGTKKNRA